MNEDLKIRIDNIRSWHDYKKEMPEIEKEMPEIEDKSKGALFRGQGNKFKEPGSKQSGWRLEPSLYRSSIKPSIKSHPHYIQWLKTIMGNHECRIRIQFFLNRYIDTKKKKDREAVTGILRHLGFRTPLLDWTKNPLKAAYFAFDSIQRETDKVTIYVFDRDAWINNKKSLTSRDLCIVELKELERGLPRQTAQESVYTSCRNSRLFDELIGDEFEGEEYFVAYCNLPASDKSKALKDLCKRGISKNSMFPEKKELKQILTDLKVKICDIDFPFL